MKTCFVGSAECLDQPIRYSLTVSLAEDEKEQYGVLVEYQDEQCSVPAITASKEATLSLIELMIRGAVTPVSVQEIVEDWLLQQ